jgi:hypothetical protein
MIFAITLYSNNTQLYIYVQMWSVHNHFIFTQYTIIYLCANVECTQSFESDFASQIVMIVVYTIYCYFYGRIMFY